jgi:hypothetical protein
VILLVHSYPCQTFASIPIRAQGLKGLILVKNPLRELWFKILLSGGAPLLPSLGHVTSTAIDQYHSNLMRRDEGEVPLSADGRAGVWHWKVLTNRITFPPGKGNSMSSILYPCQIFVSNPNNRRRRGNGDLPQAKSALST